MRIDKLHFFILFLVSVFLLSIMADYLSSEFNYTITAIISLVFSLENE